jgi:dCTP deaminase
MAKYSLLNNKQITDYMASGEILIEPFNDKQLNTNSYDVTLGEWYFRENTNVLYEEWGANSNIYNTFDEDHIKRIWGEPMQAKPYLNYKKKGIFLKNIRDDDLIIFINPGERILAHTREMIGGKTTVTTMMKARSSAGRNFISTCNDAGLGDVGYYNKWTMEITNVSTRFKIPLVVGRRYAQILFFDTGTLLNEGTNYSVKGKYQNGVGAEEVAKNWSPFDMLPKMYMDYEIKK